MRSACAACATSTRGTPRSACNPARRSTSRRPSASGSGEAAAPAARDRWAATLGANAWRGWYSLVSLAGFVLLVHGFGMARQAPVVLYVAPAWMHAATMLLMLPVLPLWLASQVPGRINSAVRHPMLAAIMIWSFAHLLANGTLADVVLFGGFLSWSVLDRLSFLRRVERPRKMAPPGRWNDLLVIYQFRDGKVVSFKQYTDSAQWARLMP